MHLVQHRLPQWTASSKGVRLVLLREVRFQVWRTDGIPARDADPDVVGRIVRKRSIVAHQTLIGNMDIDVLLDTFFPLLSHDLGESE